MEKSNSTEFRNLDILIKDTQIIDGTGKPAYKGNIAIQGERIVAVGDTQNDAGVVIDGSGLVTCPGFIDPHTHVDLTIRLYPLPARRFGLEDRGILKPGAFADIVVFNFESITDNTDNWVMQRCDG
ncbi:MAG: hypothetical protein GY850_44145 [bacterium]|nr:hypothetical protein [bacterium]